ncbi:MAG: DsbE family thiol:disulfide interchange protein [Lysobacterales bacterium]
MKKFWLVLPLLAFVGLGWLLKSGIGKDPTQVPSPLISKPAPAFDLPLLSDLNQRLSKGDLLGKPYLLNVWASWCPGCQVEHPYIEQLANRGEIPVYGLNWRDETDDARRWLEYFGDPYQAVLHDLDGRTGVDFGVYGAPETFLIGADGTVLAKHIGEMTEDIYQSLFVPLIKATPAS